MGKKKIVLDSEKLKSYIKKNDDSYDDYNFEPHSITELVIIKTRIQLALASRNQVNKRWDSNLPAT